MPKQADNKLTSVRTAYITIGNGKVETTQEILGGKVFADFDAEGKLIGFEFISPVKVELDGELK